MFTIASIHVFQGYTSEYMSIDYLPSSLYADTHGYKDWFNETFPIPDYTEVHVHSFAAADMDYNGYYNLYTQVRETDDAPWHVWGIGRDDDSMSVYESGCRAFAMIWDRLRDVSPHHFTWKARAFIKDETTDTSDGEFNVDGMVYED